MDRFYITTPIYYVNDKPHIGHAYTTILCDAFARFNRLMGRRVHFLTGTDEHGEKIERSAAALERTPQQHVDAMVEHFKNVWKLLAISHDDFIRTTEDRHKTVVRAFIRQLVTTGDIYKGAYKGWYCVPCESFWTAGQLAEGKCPDCKRDVKQIEEQNYFFKLSKYQQWLIDYLNQHDDFILPKGKRQETLSFLKEPLEDLCISRPTSRLAWGIPFPDDEAFVVYVWFDALVNYISAIGCGSEPDSFQAWWPADIHMMAKDILRQHTVYWPIMLKAAGIELPRHVIAHGWWTIEGDKMSKSRGNVVDPVHMVEVYGVDTFRYYMLREASLGSDGAYSEELLIQRFNSDLANDLGNLVYRALSMLEKYRGLVVPTVVPAKLTHPLRSLVEGLAARMDTAMNSDYDPKSALGCVWELVTTANRFVEETKPWQLAKDTARAGELDQFLYMLLESIRVIGVGLAAFLPQTSANILAKLGTPVADRAALSTWGRLVPGTTLDKGMPLFPKIEVK